VSSLILTQEPTVVAPLGRTDAPNSLFPNGVLRAYYEPTSETAENLELMRLIDKEYTAHPFFGSRKFVRWLIGQRVMR